MHFCTKLVKEAKEVHHKGNVYKKGKHLFACKLTQEACKEYILSSRGLTMAIGNLLLQCLLTAVILHSQLVLTAGENTLHLYLCHR